MDGALIPESSKAVDANQVPISSLGGPKLQREENDHPAPAISDKYGPFASMPQASRAARVEHFTKDMPKEIPNSSLQPKLFSKPDEFSASVEDIASTFQFGAPLSINPGQFVREVRGQSPSNGQDISLEPEAQLGSPRLIDSGISDQNLVGSVNRNLPGFQGGKHPRPITIGSGHAESCGLSVDLAQRHPLSGAMARQEMSFNKNNTGRLPTDGKGRDIYRDNTGQSKPQEKELFSFTLLPNPTSSQSINFDYDAAHTKRQRLGARNGAEDTSKQSKQDVLLQQYHDKYANRARRSADQLPNPHPRSKSDIAPGTLFNNDAKSLDKISTEIQATSEFSSQINDLTFSPQRVFPGPDQGSTGRSGRHKMASRSTGQQSTSAGLRSRAISRISNVSNMARHRSPHHKDRHSHSKNRNRSTRKEVAKRYSTKFAGFWNQLTAEIGDTADAELGEAEFRINELERRLSTQAEQVSAHVAQIEAKDEKIRELNQDRDGMKEQIKSTEQELENYSARMKAMEAKFHHCKEHLNAALEEQQSLYLRSKEQCQKAIQEIRQSEEAHKASIQENKANSEALREDFSRKVQQTIAQGKLEVQQMCDQIQRLSHQVQEKDLELGREKTAVQTLTEKLHAQAAAASCLEDINTQAERIISRLTNQEARSTQIEKLLVQSNQYLLGDMPQKLDKLVNMASAEPRLLTDFCETHNESMSEITSKLSEILNAQSQAQQAATLLASNLDAHVGDMWQHFDAREDALAIRLEEKSQENAMLSTNYEQKDQECQELATRFEQAQQHVEQHVEDCDKLKVQLTAFQNASRPDQEISVKLRSLEIEKQRLEAEVSARDSTITRLQEQLRKQLEPFPSRDEAFKNEALKFTEILVQKEAALQNTVKQVVEAACSGLRADFEGSNASMHKALSRFEEAQALVVSQLAPVEPTADNSLGAVLRKHSPFVTTPGPDLSESDHEMLTSTMMQNMLRIEGHQKSEAIAIGNLNTDLGIAQRSLSQISKTLQQYGPRVDDMLSMLRQLIQQTTAPNASGKNTRDMAVQVSPTAEKLIYHAAASLTTEQERPNKYGSPVLEPPPYRHQLSSHSEGESFGQETLLNGRPLIQKSSAVLNAFPGADLMAAGEVSLPSYVPRSISKDNRHVIVRSPDDYENTPIPPSIEQEKIRRRELVDLKSIIKSTQIDTSTHRGPGDDEGKGQAERLPGFGSFSRTTYNRPVAGALLTMAGKKVDTKLVSFELEEDSASTVTDVPLSLSIQSMKRKRIQGSNDSQETVRRTKRERNLGLKQPVEPQSLSSMTDLAPDHNSMIKVESSNEGMELNHVESLEEVSLNHATGSEAFTRRSTMRGMRTAPSVIPRDARQTGSQEFTIASQEAPGRYLPRPGLPRTAKSPTVTADLPRNPLQRTRSMITRTSLTALAVKSP